MEFVNFEKCFSFRLCSLNAVEQAQLKFQFEAIADDHNNYSDQRVNDDVEAESSTR